MDNNNNNDNNYFQGQTPPQGSGQAPGYPPQYSAPQMQNQYNEVPAAIKKWNWGAMMFNIFWGIGNNAYLALLCLVPCLNIIWMFVCGAMGNQWAWKSGEFKDVEQFMAVQRTWNRAGFVYFIITLISIVLSIIVSVAFTSLLANVFYELSNSMYY